MDTKERVLAVLSYLGVLILIPIFWRKRSDILNSHIRSGIVMLIVWIVLLFLMRLPLAGIVLGLLLLIAALIFTVWGIYDAVTGKEAKIPGVEKVASFFDII